MKWILVIDGQYVRVPLDFDEAKIWEYILQRQFPQARIGIVSWN